MPEGEKDLGMAQGDHWQVKNLEASRERLAVRLDSTWNRHSRGRELNILFHCKDSVSQRSSLWDSSFMFGFDNKRWESSGKKKKK